MFTAGHHPAGDLLCRKSFGRSLVAKADVEKHRASQAHAAQQVRKRIAAHGMDRSLED